MAKQNGLGDNFYVDEFDVSGDIGSLSSISGPLTVQDITPINKSAMVRQGLLHDGSMSFGSFWNPTNVGTLNSAHDVLKGRPVTDRQCSYFRSTVLGAPVASLISKQINYDSNRNQDGSLTATTDVSANGFGLEWGVNLTAGIDTDTAGANGATVDLGASPTSFSFGWAAYLHAFSFTGTSVTFKIQDSADGTTWADLSGAGFTALTAAGRQRIASVSSTATVRRYARVVSSGTFTNVTFAVNFVRYEVGGHA